MYEEALRRTVDYVLRDLISSLDYDLYKSLRENEETGEDDFPALVDEVIKDGLEKFAEELSDALVG